MDEVDRIRTLLETGAVNSIAIMLKANPDLANSKIAWGPDKKNVTDPLHYISDCVFNGSLNGDLAAELARLLIENGALINGSENTEPPLIGATSLSAVSVALVLIEHGADINLVALFGATALHWAAYVGTPTVVTSLLEKGASHEVRCSEFDSTPLFWAVQGFSKYGPAKVSNQIEVAEILLSNGANVHTKNIEGVTAIERSRESSMDSMTRLLKNYVTER